MRLLIRSRPHVSWPGLLFLLVVGWLATPHAVPLYDGLGAPDEPYRSVATGGLGRTAAPTEARGMLHVLGGVNPGGLIVNSEEQGAQVSIYAPARAFGVPLPGADITVLARAVPLTGPPAGKPDSNDYSVSFTSPAGTVSMREGAQPAMITMRAVTAAAPYPVMEIRSPGAMSWRALATTRTGNDLFTSPLPGAGEFLLVQVAGHDGGGKTLLLGGVGVTAALLVVLLVVVRLRSRAA